MKLQKPLQVPDIAVLTSKETWVRWFLKYHADDNDANDHRGIQERGTLAAVSAAAEALASARDL